MAVVEQFGQYGEIATTVEPTVGDKELAHHDDLGEFLLCNRAANDVKRLSPQVVGSEAAIGEHRRHGAADCGHGEHRGTRWCL